MISKSGLKTTSLTKFELLNLYWTKYCVTPVTGFQVSNIFEIAKVSNKSNLIFLCYSGLESSLNWFVSSELMKNKNSRLYEGSIFDWVDKNKELF